MTRRPYIDWLRGVAVLLMISWHSIDSWAVPTGRSTFAWRVIMFGAGWAAPLFLFLAGVSLALAGAARLSRGESRRDAARSLVVRGWQVFLIAHLFRLQSFLLNVNASWNGVLKPDILNILGLGLVATAFCWGRAAASTSTLVRWLLVPAVLILIVVTPWSRHWWWPTLLHPRLEAYIRPVSNYGQFTLFPTIGLIFVGAFLGALMATEARPDAKFHRRAALAGALVLGASLALAPIGTRWTTWADSPALFLYQTGAMTLALAASWFLWRQRSPARRSPIVVFGQTSLFVYWVHVELVYGVLSYPLHHALALPWAIAAYVLLTIAMFGAAVLWQQREKGWLQVPAHMRAKTTMAPPA